MAPAEGKLETDGFELVRELVSVRQVLGGLEDLEALISPGSAGTRRGVAGVPCVRRWLESGTLLRGLSQTGGSGWFPVRALLFDKSPTANWGVPWHQDLAVAVAGRREAPGFGPWSVKEGVVHVHPPVRVLERMVTVRVSLDACGPENGALRVLPGTHLLGKLSATGIARWKAEVAPVTCTAGRGDAVLMKPLLLHASSPAVVPLRRRVLHVEFACEPLPHGLKWASLTP